MWNLIIGFIGGPVIKGLIDAYNMHLKAQSADAATAANLAGKEIAAQTRDVEVAADIVKAEQGRWYTACIRPLMALPFIIFTWKIVVIDKVLKMGTTDPLDPNMWTVFTAVVVAYFGGRSLEKIARIIKR